MAMGMAKPRVWPADESQRKWLRDQQKKRRKTKTVVTESAKPGSLHPAGSTAPTRDIEIPAIQTVLNALKPLDYKARDRVMDYAISWCVDPKRQPGQ